MSPITHLSELFTKFPGIGPRQARRFVFYLLHNDIKVAEDLIATIREVKASTRQCSACFRFFTIKKYGQVGTLCDICTDETTDHSTLLLVEKDADLENIRKAGIYQGLYFVLGGLLSILEKNPEQKVRIKELEKRINKLAEEGQLQEIILALSASVEGDTTTEYVHKRLETLKEKYTFTLSTLGRGLSTGLELEYSDPDTIREALQSRKK